MHNALKVVHYPHGAILSSWLGSEKFDQVFRAITLPFLNLQSADAVFWRSGVHTWMSILQSMYFPTLLLTQGELHCGIPCCPKSAQVTCHMYLIKWAEGNALGAHFWNLLGNLQTGTVLSFSQERENERTDKYCRNRIGDSLQSKRHIFWWRGGGQGLFNGADTFYNWGSHHQRLVKKNAHGNRLTYSHAGGR